MGSGANRGNSPLKSISPALKAHLALPVTSLATCWLIIRTDGRQFAFTTADFDVTIAGVTYSSVYGFAATAVSSGSTGQVDSLELAGVLADAGITRDDLKNGLFAYAQVFLSAVNWADLTMGQLKLRRGWLGEVTLSQAGVFKAELHGLTKALQQEFGNVLMPICRADLGDALCKVPIAPPAWQPGTQYTIAAVPGQSYVSNSFCTPLTKSTSALQQALFRAAVVSGPSGTTEPAWDTTVGHQTTDGGVVWESALPLRRIGTVTAPIDQHNFTVAPLVYPGAQPANVPGNQLNNTATITVRNNISAGTVIEISDGINPPISETFIFDTALNTASDLIIARINEGTTGIRIASITGNTNINLINTSGYQGNIVKTGDIANPSGFLITNFTENYLDGCSISWLTGANAGTSTEMKAYNSGNSTVTTWLGLHYPVQIGDTFLYYPGCDKRRETCFQKFGNILNFRGEPDVPGLDAALTYPDLS